MQINIKNRIPIENYETIYPLENTTLLDIKSTNSPSPEVFPTKTAIPKPTLSAFMGSFIDTDDNHKYTKTPTIPTPYPKMTNENGDLLTITWGDYSGPKTWPSIQIPPPIESLGTLPIVDNQISILLLGNDHRPYMGTRTDTIMLLVLNLDQSTASLLSIPRDLYVYAPGWTMLKINTVQPRGGYDLLYETFKYNFGITPDYYMNISRDAIIEVINILEGVRIYVPTALDDPVFANGDYSVEKGWTIMDGATARWYVSSRITTNDFDRNLRQQAVLEGIFNKLMSLDAINNIPGFYNIFIEHVKTNLTLSDLFQFVPLAFDIDNYDSIDRFAIRWQDVESSYTPVSHAFIYIPNQENIYKIMNAVLSP